jgi:hypothetical protein
VDRTVRSAVAAFSGTLAIAPWLSARKRGDNRAGGIDTWWMHSHTHASGGSWPVLSTAAAPLGTARLTCDILCISKLLWNVPRMALDGSRGAFLCVRRW